MTSEELPSSSHDGSRFWHFSPQSIVNDLLRPTFSLSEEALKAELVTWSHSYSPPWEKESTNWAKPERLQAVLEDARTHDVIISAPSGIGKSSLLREVAWAIHTQGRPVFAWSAKNTRSDGLTLTDKYYQRAAKGIENTFGNTIVNFLYRPTLVVDNIDYLWLKNPHARNTRADILTLISKMNGVRLIATQHSDWPVDQINQEVRSLLDRRIHSASIQQL